MRNGTKVNYEVTEDDAGWIMSNTFLILTMQTGFGMLEAGSVSHKNVANIMIKNCVDVTLGGFVYWSFGYALSYGEPSTPFFGYGNFFVTADLNEDDAGSIFAHYVFQLSFATAATTIVSGAVAERMRLEAYMLFAVLNTLGYCLPAMWTWHRNGFLYAMGFFDFVGGCVVHGTGGASALVAAYMLGPRYNRFKKGPDGVHYTASSPATALTGLFMLWWAWLGFNCGSTFGISKDRWKISAKVAVTTLNGSIAGGIVGLISSYIVFKGRFSIDYIIVSVLSGLVSITASCAVISPAEALIVGFIGAFLALLALNFLEYMEIDDPVGAIPTHFTSAAWGTIVVGIFGKDDLSLLGGHNGLLHGGDFHLLKVQAIGWLLISLWSGLFTWAVFYAMHKVGILRMSLKDELLGADWVVHGVRSETITTKIEKILEQLNIAEEQFQDILKKIIIELTSNTYYRPPRFPLSAIISDELGDNQLSKERAADGRMRLMSRALSIQVADCWPAFNANIYTSEDIIPKANEPVNNSNSRLGTKNISANRTYRGSFLQRRASHIV